MKLYNSTVQNNHIILQQGLKHEAIEWQYFYNIIYRLTISYNSQVVVSFLSAVECPVQHVLVVCNLQRKADQDEDTPPQMCFQKAEGVE